MKNESVTEHDEMFIGEREYNAKVRRILLPENTADIMQLNEIESITVAVRNEMLKLDYSKKQKSTIFIADLVQY